VKHSIVLLLVLAFLVLSALARPASAAQQTVGLFINEPGSFQGYTLFSPINYPTTYLIDNEGRVVHTWNTGLGFSAYLLNDGSLLTSSVGPNPTFVAGGATGQVKKFDWDGSLTWLFNYTSADYMAHHDIEPLPNGNVLVMAWERKTGADSITAGRNPSLLQDNELWPEEILEVHQTGPASGDIVWQWHAWDHLVQDYDVGAGNFGVVADHPELINLNFKDASLPAQADWLHANGVDYNADLDQVVLSVRSFSEFWVIDHSTTTAEAAGHAGGAREKGGDILYRWGNPQTYDAGTESDRQLFFQHDVEWIPQGYPGAGDLTLFNNGPRPGGNFSTVDELIPPVDGSGSYPLTPGEAYGPAAPVWSYTAPNPTSLYSQFISGATRQPNGNTLIASGFQGTFTEVKPDGTVVWKYVNPVAGPGPTAQGSPIPGGIGNAIFRGYRYAPDYPGLAGRDLTPGDVIEITDSDHDGLLNLDELKVYGTSPILADTDGDYCGDGREVGTNEFLGGSRDPLDPWDYFDPSHDGKVRINDVLLVRNQYFKDEGSPDYNADMDRTLIGPDAWTLGPPDGLERVDDIVNVVNQYFHDCT
jgi:hypothetical protein